MRREIIRKSSKAELNYLIWCVHFSLFATRERNSCDCRTKTVNNFLDFHMCPSRSNYKHFWVLVTVKLIEWGGKKCRKHLKSEGSNATWFRSSENEKCKWDWKLKIGNSSECFEVLSELWRHENVMMGGKYRKIDEIKTSGTFDVASNLRKPSMINDAVACESQTHFHSNSLKKINRLWLGPIEESLSVQIIWKIASDEKIFIINCVLHDADEKNDEHYSESFCKHWARHLLRLEHDET